MEQEACEQAGLAEVEEVLGGQIRVGRFQAPGGDLGVEMPIAREVERALFEGKSVQRCLVDLLARESKDELADFDRWMARLAERPTGERPTQA